MRNEADLGLGPFAISRERYQAIEFCGRVGGDYTCILVTYPEDSVSLTSAFDVFSTGIWVGWIISGAVIVAVSVVLGFLTKRLRVKDRKIDAGAIAWYLYGVMISQGSFFPQCRLPQRLLLATWCFVAFVFVNIYNSTLTSYLSVTFQRPEINSLSDLTKNPSYKATILAGSIQEIDLQRSNDEVGQTAAGLIQKCGSDCRKFSLQEMATIVEEKENYVSIIPCSPGISFLKNRNAKGNKCILTLAHEIKSWKPMFFAVPKSSPFIEEINRESQWFIDVGLRDYWYGQHDKQPEKCKLQYNSKGVATKRFSKRIKLQQFYLPFLILFSGCLLALIQFCREKLFYRASA
ncbi:glutamate receptor ionotropic, delta-1-like isoform X2 [Daphnia carinata]|uniref:glutamate receptor ionotropic, delta-1-like isoform X2 n=1 Tax=Daphnia carinata TaxID=120202 RepID=UPI0028685437|nr:glutamate receptor ionotropic, delta-1-like isoform X2 [Daphnia carinata]